MRKTLLAFAAALALIGSAAARDLTTTDGKVYQNVMITKITPLGLVFVCDGKSGWADFRDLPQDVQSEFGYDPQKAQDYEQSLAQNNGMESSPQGQLPAYDPSQYPPEAQPLPQGQQPPAGSTVIYASDIQSDSDLSDAAAVCAGPASNAYIYYNNQYYPYYYWSHWYQDHHWVWNNGRPYPWTYANHHGVWENGKYYPYEHGRLYQSNDWRQADQERANRASSFNRGVQSYQPSPGAHSGGGSFHGGGGRR